MAKVGSAEVDVTLRDSAYRDGLKRLEQSTDATLNRLSSRFTKVGKALTLGVTAPLTALAGIGVRSVMQLETFSATLNVLIGDAERANRVFDELYQFSADTPFDWKTLTESTRVLSAFGVEAENIIPTLSRLGDVAAGLQTPLNELAEVYGRVLVTGRMGMEEVNRLADRGVPIYTELSKIMGVGADQVRELVSAGVVGFPELEEVIISLTSEGGMFFGMMDEQTKTLAGRLSRLKDTFEQVTDLIGERFAPVFDRLVSAGQAASDWFVELDEGMQNLIISMGAIAAAAGPVLVALGGFLVILPKIQAGLIAARLAGIAFLGPAGWVVAGVSAVVALAMALGGSGNPDSLANALEKVDTTISSADALNNFEEVFTSLADTLSGPVKRAFQGARDDIWEIVSAAEDARAALATIQLGSQLSQQLASTPAIASALPVDIRGREYGAQYRLNEMLVRGNFDGAIALLDSIVNDIAVMERMASGLTASESGPAKVLDSPLFEFYKDVIAGRDQLNALLQSSGTDGAGGRSPRNSVTGLVRDVRTVQDVLDELAAAGTYENRWAALEGTPEAVITAAENRIQLIEGALRELVRDFYDDLTQETINDLRARAEAARREAVRAQGQINAAQGQIIGIPDDPIGLPDWQLYELEQVANAIDEIGVAGVRVAEYLGQAEDPIDEYIRYLQRLAATPRLPSDAVAQVNEYIAQLQRLQRYNEGLQPSKPSDTIIGLSDEPTGTASVTLEQIDRVIDGIDRMGQISRRTAELMGRAAPETEVERLIGELMRLQNLQGMPPGTVEEIGELISELMVLKRHADRFATSSTVSDAIATVLEPLDNYDDTEAMRLRNNMQSSMDIMAEVGSITGEVNRILGQTPDALSGTIAALEALARSANIDPFSLKQVNDMLASLRTFQRYQATQQPASPASSIAGLQDPLDGLGSGSEATLLRLQTLQDGIEEFGFITEAAAALMGQAPTEVERLISSLEQLERLPELTRFMGNDIRALIEALETWRDTQAELQGNKETFETLRRQIAGVTDTSLILAGALDPLIEELKLLLMTVTDPELQAQIEEALEAAEDRRAEVITSSAEKFKNDIITASIRFGDNIFAALRKGDAGSAVGAGIGLLGDLGSILFPGSGQWIQFGARILGDLLGGVFGGGAQREQEERELAERMSRTTPSLSLNVSVVQNNNYGTSNADPVVRADNDRRTREIVVHVLEEVGYSALRERVMGGTA